MNGAAVARGGTPFQTGKGERNHGRLGNGVMGRRGEGGWRRPGQAVGDGQISGPGWGTAICGTGTWEVGLLVHGRFISSGESDLLG